MRKLVVVLLVIGLLVGMVVAVSAEAQGSLRSMEFVDHFLGGNHSPDVPAPCGGGNGGGEPG
jgi:uncharacterized membrane protein